MKDLLKKLGSKVSTRLSASTPSKPEVLDQPRFTKMRHKQFPVLHCCIAYNKYGGYCVPLSSKHRPAARCIMRGKVFERETIRYVTAHCGEGDIIHAGAYFGDFIPVFARACSDHNVWAFEPNPENYACASMTVQINQLDNVVLTNAAVGAAAGTAEMKVRDKLGRSTGGGSSIVQKRRVTTQTIHVPVMAIDDVVPSDRHVSLIQLDVERYEEQALRGAIKTIERCRPILILEHIPKSPWFSEHILSQGYEKRDEICGNTVFRV